MQLAFLDRDPFETMIAEAPSLLTVECPGSATAPILTNAGREMTAVTDPQTGGATVIESDNDGGR